ncbi:MAG: hypothetical protein GTN71_08785, partial [Anaerolineae bacterium]|nr:hypothetical protein [Anaerolineae bacterium]
MTDLYPDVQFYDNFWNGCIKNAHFNYGEVVDFQPPAGIADPPDRKISDVVVDADYL